MKNSFLTTALTVILITAMNSIFAQGPAGRGADSTAIMKCVIGYIDGFYSGDVSKIETSVVPDLFRATPLNFQQTGRAALGFTTYSGLIEAVRAKQGALDDTARHVSVKILDIGDDVANVKVISAAFTEYLQVIKLDVDWKIINSLYTAGLLGPARIRDFNASAEKSAVEQTGLDYLIGQTGCDAKRLELTLDPGFSRIAFFNMPVTNKTSFRRLRYEMAVENALAGVGKQDEIYRDNTSYAIDITDGLAVACCETAGAMEYVQMYKNGSKWEIVNSVLKAKKNYSLADAMTVTVGNPMPDFSLPVYNGSKFTLSQYRGKNVLLVFPRGWLRNSWCAYCPYQYLELEQMEINDGIQDKNNLKIAFVLPYGMNKIKDWMEKFPEAVQAVENNKNPQPAPVPGSIQAQYADWVKANFPIVFNVKPDDAHKVIPVLSDEQRTLSKRLKIFTGFWDGVSAEQNMASVFIIDSKGILRFKYIGQMTEDRPSVDFLLDFVKNMK